MTPPPAPDWDLALAGRVGDLDLDVRFVVEAGPVVLVGENGSGKTTLLRALAGAASGLAGHARLRGRTLMDTARGVDLPPEARRVGYVPQGHGLFPHLSVLDNVRYGIRAAQAGPGAGPGAADAAAMAALSRTAAEHLARRMPRALSGGERQRVALARALASSPLGLLLDEPMASLDARARTQQRAALAAWLSDEAVPAIVVTHDRRDVLALGGVVVVLEAGRVVRQGSAAEIAASPGGAFAQELLGRSPSPPG